METKQYFNADESAKPAEIGVLEANEHVDVLDANAAPQKKRFTVDEYHRMADVGILGENERVELIEGEILCMSPIGLRHIACVDELTFLVIEKLGRNAQVRVQSSIRLNNATEPQPDISILKPRDDRYARKAATPEDVYVIIEVAESSIEKDRKRKLSLYARNGIPEVWIVDLVEGFVEQYCEPTSGAYMKIEKWTIGQQIQSHQLPSLTLSVEMFLQF